MDQDNQIKHHLYWIMRDYGVIKGSKEELQEKYKEIMENDLTGVVCKEIDELVAHIKLNY